jgi:hypothetical protein
LAHIIHFQVIRRGVVKRAESNLLSSEQLERVAKNYIRKKMFLFTTTGRSMSADQAFETVVSNGTYTILLIPREEKINIDTELIPFNAWPEKERLGRSGRPKKEPKRYGITSFAGLVTGAGMSNRFKDNSPADLKGLGNKVSRVQQSGVVESDEGEKLSEGPRTKRAKIR